MVVALARRRSITFEQDRSSCTATFGNGLPPCRVEQSRTKARTTPLCSAFLINDPLFSFHRLPMFAVQSSPGQIFSIVSNFNDVAKCGSCMRRTYCLEIECLLPLAWQCKPLNTSSYNTKPSTTFNNIMDHGSSSA